MPNPTVPFNTRISYALPAFALAVVGIPIYVYIPKFYTDVVGVDIAALGGILLLMRLFDAVSDPAIGMLSDRTRTRFGRRRPWMIAAVGPLVLSIMMLFMPPETLPDAWRSAWFATAMFAVFLAWTCVAVPYESLGPEITFDYDERTSLLGLRDGLLILGTMAAAASPIIVAGVLGLDDSASGERAKFNAVAWLYCPLLIAFCAICVWRVRERPRNVAAAPSTSNPLTSLKQLAGNRPFMILLASYGVTAIGSNLPATLIPFYVEYVIGDPNAEAFLLLYFVVGVALLPFWIWLAKRIGKKQAWIASGSLNAISFAMVFFLGPGQTTEYAVLVAVSGIGFGATLALPSSMQADVIDYEELRSGNRREGEIIGVWSVFKKLAAALGVGLALPILGWVGYMPNTEQPEQVQFTLRVLYALVPSVLTLVGLVIALAYPISKQKHVEILAAIEQQRRHEPRRDPLDTRASSAA